MTWDDFYDRFFDWSESTVKTKISSLEDIGNGEDVVDVCLNLGDEKIKAQLIRKSMKLGVKFTHDDFMNLDGEIPEALFEEVARYAGFSAENPFFNENDFDWDDFYASCADLPEDMVSRCIPRIKKFGDSDEVTDAVLSLSYPADDALYERAVACGVNFTEEQLEEMGRQEVSFVEDIKAFNDISEEQMDEFSEQVRMVEEQVDEYIEQTKNPKKRRASVGKAIGLGAFFGMLSGLFGTKKKHRGHCNGDCANCPSHYGYRYGRWYYGHGHNYGCEFGGNKGGGGKD
ncbi:MAG: hypothetical protein IJF33_01885 [Clostridia bacterium]|nr:hypothetical protein [Clostridia bacterium]